MKTLCVLISHVPIQKSCMLYLLFHVFTYQSRISVHVQHPIYVSGRLKPDLNDNKTIQGHYRSVMAQFCLLVLGRFYAEIYRTSNAFPNQVSMDDIGPVMVRY